MVWASRTPAASCAGLLKLPDVLIADEDDVRELEDGAELRLLLKQPPAVPVGAIAVAAMPVGAIPVGPIAIMPRMA